MILRCGILKNSSIIEVISLFYNAMIGQRKQKKRKKRKRKDRSFSNHTKVLGNHILKDAKNFY